MPTVPAMPGLLSTLFVPPQIQELERITLNITNKTFPKKKIFVRICVHKSLQLYSELCSVQSLNTDIMFLAEQFQISFLANHVAHFCIQTRPLRDPGIVENKIPVFVGILVKHTRQCFQRLGFQTTLFSLQGTQSA